MGVLRKSVKMLSKTICYALFSIGSLVLGLVVQPIERAFIHSPEEFKKTGRATISKTMRGFLKITKRMGVFEFSYPLPDFSNLEGKIVVSNHPSLFDIVILFALIPGANCIVRGALTKSAMGFIIRALYIVNNEDFDSLLSDASLSLQSGDTLIIFPEGTRTRKGEEITLKRGTAYIALESMAEIAIYIIGGNSKDGLRKNDKPWNINSDGRYLFSFRKLETTLDPREYATGHTRDDAIRLTKDMEEILRKEAGKEGN